jgi:hypothetical protein
MPWTQWRVTRWPQALNFAELHWKIPCLWQRLATAFAMPSTLAGWLTEPLAHC